MVDRSAIRVFATPTLRKHDIGVLFTGPAEKLAPIPPGRPSHFHNSVCSFYSAAYPKRTNWTVFGYNFHAHLLGRAFATEIWAKPDWQTNTTAKARSLAVEIPKHQSARRRLLQGWRLPLLPGDCPPADGTAAGCGCGCGCTWAAFVAYWRPIYTPFRCLRAGCRRGTGSFLEF